MSARQEYEASRAINWSLLKHMKDSPLAFRYASEHPRADTKAFAMGRATHALVFEPHIFNAEFAIWEGGARRGDEWKEFAAENADKTILTESEIEPCIAMADAVLAHPLVAPYLGDGRFELPLYWTDADTGIECKARPDWISGRTLIDLKTTRSIHPKRFGAECARYGYHHQLAHYRNGMIATGNRPQRVLIVAVEKDPPHDVGVFEIDRETLTIASDEVAELLTRLAECMAADSWPGRYAEEQALQLPAWVYCTDDEDDAESLGLITGD